MNALSLLATTYQRYDSATGITTTTTATEAHAAGAVFALIIGALVVLFILAVTYVISSWFTSRIFKKAGVKSWVGWVPVYNQWKLLELGGQQGFWAVLALLPVINWVAMVFFYIATYEIGLRFGKSGGWVVLAIFLPIVWLGVFAFNDAKWNGPQIEPKA